ncbi:MAG: tetratricopeptide repeat protein [Acidobacteriota bacterium]
MNHHRFSIAAIALTATLLKPTLAQTSTPPQTAPSYTPAAPHGFGEVSNLAALQKQAASGDPEAAFQLGEAYWIGTTIPKDLALAQQWMDKASAAGSLEAQLFLGMALYTGYNIPKDHARAAHYLQLAADKTPAEPVAALAQYTLATMYQQGDALPQSTPKAIHYYQLAIAANSSAAAFDLGTLYFNGTGTKPDKDTACDLFQQAGQQGHVPSIAALAFCYEQGQGREKDHSRALELYKLAGDAGNFLASAKAANLYLERKKLSEAYAWFRISQSEGNPSVQPDLDRLKPILNPLQLAASNAAFIQWQAQHTPPTP